MALKDYEAQMVRCARCSLCKWPPLAQIKSWRFSNVCPSTARYNFHAYSGSGKIIMAYGLTTGKIGYTDAFTDIVYKCTLCGACDVSCKYNLGEMLEPFEILHELRVKCVEDGKIPDRHKKLFEDMKKHDNPYREPKEKRVDWAKGLDIKDITKEGAEVLYYVGCTAAFRLPEVARRTAMILKNAGVNFGILGEAEVCCGSTTSKIGNVKLFEEFAKRNIETFNKLGLKTIVTSCAGCYHMLKVHYPRIAELKPEVLHTVEFVERLIEEGKLKLDKELPMRVTYHDPCHLGRLAEPYVAWEGEKKKVLGHLIIHDPPKPFRGGANGIYEPPRNVLKKIPGLEFLEMERIKEYAFCCGAGAGVKAAYPDFALWSAKERIEEAKATGADAIVTCCPFCERNLGDAIREGNEEIKLYDLVELISQSMGGG